MMFNYYRKYVSSLGEFTEFYNSLPRKLTLRPIPHAMDSLLMNDHRTPFNEVRIKQYYLPPNVSRLIRELKGTNPKPNPNWTKDLYNILKKSVEDSWDPKKFHLIGHSGGFDSRIISTIIMQLYRKHGKDWLGDILFVENGGEKEAFLKIMQKQGWKKDQYFVFNETAPNNEYHAHSLNLKDAYRRFNGLSGFPFNLWFDPYDKMQGYGLIPETSKIQGYSGLGAYIERAFKDLTIDRWFLENYYYQLSVFRMKGKWHFPFWDYRYIRALAKYKEVRNNNTRTSVAIATNQCGYLSHIPRTTLVRVKAEGYRTLSSRLFDHVRREYMQSWFGKNVPCTPTNIIRYNKWWAHWLVASMCEHLRGKGHVIRVNP